MKIVNRPTWELSIWKGYVPFDAGYYKGTDIGAVFCFIGVRLDLFPKAKKNDKED